MWFLKGNAWLRNILPAVLCCLIVCSVSARFSSRGLVTSGQFQDIHVYLYNSELRKTFTTRDGRQFPIEIKPKAVVEFTSPESLTGRSIQIAADFRSSSDLSLLKASRTVNAKPKLKLEFEVAGPLPSASYAVIEFTVDGSSTSSRVELNNKRLSGKVTGFGGAKSQQPAYVILESELNTFVAATPVSGDGSYEISVPSRRYHTIWAVDEGFGNSSLERYAYNVNLDRDLQLDFRIGQSEIYRLSGMQTAEHTYVAEFSVFTVHTFLDRQVEAQLRLGKAFNISAFIADLSNYPVIDRNAVKVLIDGQAAEVWTVERTLSSLKQYGRSDRSRPYWLVEGPVPPNVGEGNHSLTIILTTTAEQGGKSIEEHGEGSYQSFYVW